MATARPKLGAFKDKRDPRDFKFSAVTFRSTPPPVVDYETAMPPVRNQEQRGACVSFACNAVKEYQELKQRPKVKKSSLDLAEEFVYMQIRQKGGGAFPRDAFKLLTDVGVCTESLMPYRTKRKDGKARTDEDDDGEDPWIPEQHKRARANARIYRARAYARVSGVNSMMESIATNGPIMIGVSWLDGWFDDKSKKKEDGYPILDVGQGPKAGGHAISVVGYDAVRKLFKIRNSWGPGWGKGGYAWITFAAIEKHCSDAWTSLDVESPLIKEDALAAARKAKEKDLPRA